MVERHDREAPDAGPRPAKARPGSPGRWPAAAARPAGLAAGAGVLALAGVLRSDGVPFAMAYGNALMVAAGFLVAVAWVLYLKSDGVKFPGSGSRQGRKKAENWRDRVPDLGSPPPVPGIDPAGAGGEHPLDPPDGAGTQGAHSAADPSSSAARERLRAAEEALRSRIAGEPPKDADPALARLKTRALARDFAVSGLAALAASLALQYLA